MSRLFYTIKTILAPLLVVALLWCQQHCVEEGFLALDHQHQNGEAGSVSHGSHQPADHHHHHKDHHHEDESSGDSCCNNRNPISIVKGSSLIPDEVSSLASLFVLPSLSSQNIYEVAISSLLEDDRWRSIFNFQQRLFSLSISPNAPPRIIF